MKFTYLKYEKLVAQHSKELVGLWGDSEVIRYTNIKKPCNLSDVQKRIKKLDKFDIFSVFQQDNLIGVVGCPCIDSEKETYGFFYQLKKDYWGKGIASAVTQWMIKYMKEKYANPTFYADVVVNNIASEKILLHLGFSCISSQVDSFECDSIKMDVHNYILQAESMIGNESKNS